MFRQGRPAPWSRALLVLPAVLWMRPAASQPFQPTMAFPTSELIAGTRDIQLENRAIVFPVEQTLGLTETAREIRVELPADILFDFDKAIIRPEARQALAQAAMIIRAHPGARLRFEGHTDSKGTEAINRPLSKRRAEAVRSWLVANESLQVGGAATDGFAARRPAVPNTHPDGSDDPDGRQRNRRVEIIVAK